MELWIRSQDKELLMKSPELRYNQKENDHSILAYDTLGVYRILGVYSTKERALEVLDEIQNILTNKKGVLQAKSITKYSDLEISKNALETINNEQFIVVHYDYEFRELDNTIVYEMPEE